MGKIKYDVGEVDKLEQENRRLKTEVGKYPESRDVLRDIRGITLSRENITLAEILETYKRLGAKPTGR